MRCGDGTILPADLVLVAVGLVPNTELAALAGLDIGNGIKVDEYGQTSDPDILAVGDCCEFLLPFRGGERWRLESVPSAVELARAAASVINGAPKPYALVPWFWSDQYHYKLRSVGLAQGHDQMVVRPARTLEGFVAFYLEKGKMIAADCVNSVLEFNAAKRLISGKIAVDPAALANPEVNLKTLLSA